MARPLDDARSRGVEDARRQDDRGVTSDIEVDGEGEADDRGSLLRNGVVGEVAERCLDDADRALASFVAGVGAAEADGRGLGALMQHQDAAAWGSAHPPRDARREAVAVTVLVVRRSAASDDEPIGVEEEHLGATEEADHELTRGFVDDDVTEVWLELEDALGRTAGGREGHEEALGAGDVKRALVGDHTAGRGAGGTVEGDLAIVAERDDSPSVAERDVEAPRIILCDAARLSPVLEIVVREDRAARERQNPELVSIGVGDDRPCAVTAGQKGAAGDRRGSLVREDGRASITPERRRRPVGALLGDDDVGDEAIGEVVSGL